MAINFPTSLDTFTNPTATDQVASVTVPHATQHANANDAIEALEAKVGANGSAVTTSHDYKLSEITTTDKAVGKTATQTLTNKTLTAPRIASGGFIADANGNEQIEMTTTASAVNHINTTNAATGNDPLIDAKGSDTNISLKIKAKGTGKVKIGTAELQFPNADGTNTQVLQTNGAGVLSFATISNDSSLVPQYTYFPIITGSNLPVYNQYTDSTQLALATFSSSTIYYFNSGVTGGAQTRNLTSDWASAALITSTVTLGIYLYVYVRDASNNYRVYRYSVSNLAAGGTLMTISGQAFATTGGDKVMMTSNGTNFYFNYKGGNNASDRIISKYTISGTTLTYSSDITCGASSNVTTSLLLIDSSENIYGYYSSSLSSGDDRVRKYNSSGTLQSTSISYTGNAAWYGVFSFNTSTYIGQYHNAAGGGFSVTPYFVRIFI